ncbi:MAG: hypothetical protein VXZ51_00465 [Actinomycetota bacterium]|nr:hypothetical protein [Actinomycetota bacterium]
MVWGGKEGFARRRGEKRERGEGERMVEERRERMVLGIGIRGGRGRWRRGGGEEI